MSQIVANDVFADGAAQRERALAHISIGFILDEVATGVAGLEMMDALLVLAINQANIAPLTRDPEARRLYGALDAPAPDEARRPVSISAIAASLGLPFETARRRVRRLQALGVCVELAGGVIVPAAFLVSPAYLASVRACHLRMHAFYREVKAAGLIEELPPSRYAVEDGVPMRAATRLLSDYVLRTSEHLMSEGGDLVSALMLMELLRAGPLGSGRAALPVVALAQRLRIPVETARRHALALIERGRCSRTRQGLILTDELLSDPRWRAFLRDNAANVQRLFAGLAERGVMEAWARMERA